MKTADEFRVGMHNIGYIDSHFLERVEVSGFEPSLRETFGYQTLKELMIDKRIESGLNPGICTLSDVLALLDSKDKKFKDGEMNLFYFPSCVVSVSWFSFNRAWRVYTWQRGESGWDAGVRVFSPATDRVPQSSDSRASGPSEPLPLERLEIHAEDTDTFIGALRTQILKNCKGCSGEDVANALFALTDEMWDGGVDTAWEISGFKNRSTAGNLFCITWLTMLAAKLGKKL